MEYVVRLIIVTPEGKTLGAPIFIANNFRQSFSLQEAKRVAQKKKLEYPQYEYRIYSVRPYDETEEI